MKNITDGKAAISHIGTATFLKEDHPFPLPIGTTMLSPLGITFLVVSCQVHASKKYLVCGFIVPTSMDVDESEQSSVCLHEQFWIINGVLYPEVGWVVTFVPGLAPMPELTYYH